METVQQKHEGNNPHPQQVPVLWRTRLSLSGSPGICLNFTDVYCDITVSKNLDCSLGTIKPRLCVAQLIWIFLLADWHRRLRFWLAAATMIKDFFFLNETSKKKEGHPTVIVERKCNMRFILKISWIKSIKNIQTAVEILFLPRKRWEVWVLRLVFQKKNPGNIKRNCWMQF